ncbi:MAG: Rpp14/Pop5 family protein [Thermoproteota archaeon]
MKYKRRYIIVSFEESFSEGAENMLINTFCELYGKINFALSGFRLFYFDKNEKLMIFRCFHNYLDEYRATVFMLHDGNKKLQARTLFVTGTYKKAKKLITFLKRKDEMKL